MTTREQAIMIARQQRAGKQATPIDYSRMWNQQAADQWSQRQALLRGQPIGQDETTPTYDLVNEFGSPDGPITGTPNQIQMGLAQLERSPKWAAMGEQDRARLLQRLYGVEIAQRYTNAILNREAIAKEQRQDIASGYDTQRMLEREQRQAAARLASTEPEMLHRRLLSGDWRVDANGVMERNPAYNPNNIMGGDIPQYIPLSPSGEATIARHWDQVMPGRANPLSMEKRLAIQLGEQNPNMSAVEIAEATRAKMAAITAAQANPALAMANQDELAARQRIAGYQGRIPSAAPAPMAPTYSVEASAPSAVIPSGEALAPTARVGQRFNNFVRGFGTNMARDFAGIMPAVEARVNTLGQFLERGGLRPEMGQFMGDLFGQPTAETLPPMPVPTRRTQTESYRFLPDWLK